MLPWWKSALESPEIRPVLVASAFGSLALAVLLLFGYILASKLMNGFVDYARINAPSSTVTSVGGGGSGPGAGGEGVEVGEFGEIIDVESRAAAGGGMLTAGSAFEFMEKLPPSEAADPGFSTGGGFGGGEGGSGVASTPLRSITLNPLSSFSSGIRRPPSA